MLYKQQSLGVVVLS